MESSTENDLGKQQEQDTASIINMGICWITYGGLKPGLKATLQPFYLNTSGSSVLVSM